MTKKKKEKKRRLLKWETHYMSPKRRETSSGYEVRKVTIESGEKGRRLRAVIQPAVKFVIQLVRRQRKNLLEG